MRISFVMAAAFAVVATLSPDLASAQACDDNDEVFSVHVQGIFPDRIYHDKAIGVCFQNQSNRDLWLVYRKANGDHTWTSRINRGAQSSQLKNLGNNQEIFAANLYCGYDLLGYLKLCQDGQKPSHFARHNDMRAATLYERAAPLRY